MATPVLSEVVYSGTEIRANFTHEDNNQENFQIALFEGTSTTPTLMAPSGRLLAVLSNSQLSTTSVWSVAIAAVVDGVAGEYSSRTALIVRTPSISDVTYDGNNVTGTVTAPSGVTLDSETLKVSLYANGIAAGESVAAADGRFTIPVSGIAGIDLMVRAQLTGIKDHVATTGPFSPNAPVLASTSQSDSVSAKSPVITSAVSSSPTSLDITWDPATSPGSINGYQPYLLWDEGIFTFDPLLLTAPPYTATLTIPSVVPNGSWLTLAAMTGGSLGPFSQSVAFVPTAATELSVRYDGATISANWKAAEDNRINAYEVMFTINDQPPVIETVYTNSWSKAFTASAGQTASVSVRMLAGLSKSPATSAINAILGQPSITKTAFNGSQLALAWSAVSDSAAHAYDINVVSGGKSMAQYTSGDTSATIPFAVSADTIQIRAIGSSTSGPLSTAFTPITATPNVTSIAFDTSGSLKINWDAISVAGKYRVQFLLANQVVLTKNPTTNSLTLAPTELPPLGIYDVTVQAFGSEANDDVSGPVSAPLSAVVLPPPNVEIGYDGRNARVIWEPITSPVITGYITTILDGSTPVSSTKTIGPAASIEVDYEATNNYTVVVQALTNVGAGSPSPPAALFQSGWYPSTATTASSYLIPATVAAMSSYNIVVYLPNIFTTYVATGLPTDLPFIFSLADPPYSYKLTMPANSDVWIFNADAIRSGILDAYKNLLTKLVQLNVTPLGWRMVQDAISRAMPQTFAETLYYAYAFVPGDGYIDLKPGMLLRADFESYQYLGPDQTNSAYVDGFVSSSSAIYDVGSYVTANNQWLTGFDAFLSMVTQAGSTVLPPQSEGSTSSGGGGIVDLYYTQLRRPYVRLVYPPNVLPDNTANATTSFNVAVLAADDYPTLATATQNLRDAQPLPNAVAGTYLRGRTMISACIRVWLDEQPLVVPVGTSVGNLLENMGRRPPIVISQNGNRGIPLSGIIVERSIGYAVSDPNNYSTSKGIPIRLDWNQGMAYSANTDWLSLPLLPGDRITTRGNK
jgi:hypothetical protein